MACKCIHHPEYWLVCRSVHEGEYVLSNVAGWLADWFVQLHPFAAGVMSGWWCIMPTWCSRTQNSASPSILARFSSHGYQKVLEFTAGLENAVKSAFRCTESTTPINPRSKVTYKLWHLLLLLGCSISWSCHGLQVHPSSRVLAGVQISP